MSLRMIRPFDREALRRQFQEAEPFPFMVIDEFLDPEFAREVAASYPAYGEARGRGREFSAVNEKKKVQITDVATFPAPVKELNELLCAPSLIEDLEYITGIDNLLWDPQLEGGGMHLTGPRGRLDVHVDFNYVEARKLHRRLNILVYLNEGWKDEWGGAVELWDEKVRTCAYSLKPVLNRCVVFATSDISFHGVEPVTCPEGTQRISFAAYYYTKEAPACWDGTKHSTVFKARPYERIRGHVLMPFEKARSQLVPSAKRVVKKLIGRS
jgi:hypothetical protein